MKRIAAIVLNSVSHDARVLKEADTLSAAGYEVSIFGIQDNRCNEAEMTRESGVRIVLCDWQRPTYQIYSWLILVVGVVISSLTLLAVITQLDHIHAYLSSPQAILHAGILLSAGLAYLFFAESRRYMLIVKRMPGTEAGRPVRQHFLDLLLKLRTTIRQKASNQVSKAVRRRQILRMLRRFGPDAVHCHDLHTVPIGYAYAKRSGCKLVYDSHEIFEELSLIPWWKKRQHEFVQRRYSPRVDAFITINESIAEYLNTKYPHLPRAVIVKNAARLPDRPLRYDGRLHRAAGVGLDRKILLYQGGFAPHRGLMPLVNAAPHLPDDWCLVMMGWGNYEDTLRSLAESIDPGGRRVRFVPPAPNPELADWTCGATLGAIPYENVCLNHWFCTPNKLWEYPVAGVPILASPFPELKKTIERYRIGVLLDDPPTPKNIAETVASLRESELEAMRVHCRSFVATDNWAVYERRLVRLYNELLGQDPSKRREKRIIEPRDDAERAATRATAESPFA